MPIDPGTTAELAMSQPTMRYLDPQGDLPADTLRLANTDDPLALAAQLRGQRSIALHFPKWTDGRAYSQAVLLRGRLRWSGELIATGEVLADMLPLLRRCGFDAAQLRADQKTETAERALGFRAARAEQTPR
jgi:uncharacterized protein (DUF934 family)